MTHRFTPSYSEYEDILREIKDTGKAMDFKEAARKEEFVVIRHDIEFSVRKAAEMALIEHRNGVRASYFVQIGNNTYNPFSDENKALILVIHSYGHEIGLHYRSTGTDPAGQIERQVRELENELGITINRFSEHRPKGDTKYDKVRVPRLINAYSENFFERTDDPGNARVKYISDSKFRWNYGYPDFKTLMLNKKVQLLVHPFQWSEDGAGMAETFRRLSAEKEQEAIAAFGKEFERYKEIEEGSQR